MDQTERPRKRIEPARRPARKAARSAGVPAGRLKGRPVSELARTGLTKAPVKAARSASRGAEQIASGRKEMPLQIERSGGDATEENRSLWLRLRVEKGRITIVDAQEVEASGTLPEEARGTHFIEVRAGGQLVAAESLIDPGLAVGIPDSKDSRKEFRGHRIVETPSFETFIRVPLGALETIIARHTQGSLEKEQRSSVPKLEINIYEASEDMAVEPRGVSSLASAHRGKLDRIAESGALDLAEVRGAGGHDRKPPSEDSQTGRKR